MASYTIYGIVHMEVECINDFDLAFRVQHFSDPGIYFAGGRGQGRLAVASTNVYMFNSVVRGHHCIAFIYQAIESHSLTKHYKCMM